MACLLLVLAAAGPVIADNAMATVTVDANANRHAISPNIYGVNWGDVPEAALNVTINRFGGNANSRYNWQLEAHSSGSDWYFETYSDGSPSTPGGSVDANIRATRANLNGAEPMITIPMLDYLANLGPGRSTLPGFPVKKYGAQQKVDPWNSDAGNGVSLATGKNIVNDPLDNGVPNSPDIQKAWVQHLVDTFGLSSTPTGIKYYILDNECSIWNFTHRDAHPNPMTYQEMYDKIVAYATAIRSVDPTAKIIFGEEWSWSPMFISGFDQAHGVNDPNSDYNTHNKTYYYEWILQQLYAYKQKTGVQLIDMLSVHMYPPIGTSDSASDQALRNRETRILWDMTYKDPAWFGDIGINGRIIGWIPTMKSIVAKNFPGLQIGCTEYSWGDDDQLNGATTQADVLGIYGREGLDLATSWGSGRSWGGDNPTFYVSYLARQIYRNYDGAKSTFGDTSVAATVADPDNLSAFAATRSSDGALTVMVINKQQGSTPVTVSLANFSSRGTAQVWQINSAAQKSITRLEDVSVTSNGIATTVPSQSITLLVIAADELLPPTIPTPPASQTVVEGETATFTVTATGEGLRYQWYKDGVELTGATEATLTLPGVTPAAFGAYTVQVRNDVGSVTSEVAVLGVSLAAGGMRYRLSDYYYPAQVGNTWVYEGPSWAGHTRKRIEAVGRVITNYTGGATPQAGTATVVAQFNQYGTWAGGVLTESEHWYDYFTVTGGQVLFHGDDESDGHGGTEQFRGGGGLPFPASLAVGESLNSGGDYYRNGVWLGRMACGTRLVGIESVTVGAGTFADCLHLQLLFAKPGEGASVQDEWWAPGLGTVKNQRAAGNGTVETEALLSYTLLPPQIVTQPVAQTGVAGTALTFQVATSTTGLTYQWQVSTNGGTTWSAVANGTVYSGVGTDTLTVLKPTAVMKDNQYRCVITDGVNPAVTTTAATLTVQWSQFSALSARAPVGTGDQTLILGFVFAGGGKPTMVRGVGPGLLKGDLNLAGQELADPQLTLNELQAVNGGAQFVAIAANDNWGGTDELRTQMSALGMGALDDASADAALLTTPTRAVYTAQISGANQTTGLALAEVYDADVSDKAKRLTALSIRNQVGAGSSMLIAGLVITGDAPKKVLLRGVGPGLVPTVAEALVLANPTLQLNKLNLTTKTWEVVGTNDDWGGSAELATAMSQAGMGTLAADSKDAVLLMELQPGIYTAQLSGVGDTTGIGLVEIYEAP